jgi:hypothetical protein
MENGEEGATLLAWLNGLPVVQEILQDSFEGAPITKQNLSEWRQGGLREWQLRQEWIGQARELSDAASEMEEEVDTAALPGDLAGVLAARYAALLNGWNGEPDEKMEAQARLLRGLVRDVALLQRILLQASGQERELERESEEREEREFAERKKKTLDLLWSVPKSEALAKTLGGGKQGKKLAELITAVQHDLPLSEVKGEGRAERGERRGASGRRSPSQSNPVQPPSSAESGADLPSPTQSNPVQPSPTQSNLVQPRRARICRVKARPTQSNQKWRGQGKRT